MAASIYGPAAGPTSPNKTGPVKSPTAPDKDGPASNNVSSTIGGPDTNIASDPAIPIVTATENRRSSRNEAKVTNKVEKKQKTQDPASKVAKQKTKAAKKAEKKKQKAAIKADKKKNKGKAIEKPLLDHHGTPPINLAVIKERDRLAKIWAKGLENEITLNDAQHAIVKGIYDEVMALYTTDRLAVLRQLSLTGKATGKEITTLSGLFCFILSRTQKLTQDLLPPFPRLVMTEEMIRADEELEVWAKGNNGLARNNVPVQNNVPIQSTVPVQNAVPVQIDPNVIYQCIVNAKAWGWI